MGQRPKDKKAFTLYFDDKTQLEWFKAYWLDGGGDQQMGQTYTESWGKDWAYMKTVEEACSKCGYFDESAMDRAFQNKQLDTISMTCLNCAKTYSFDNPYFEKK